MLGLRDIRQEKILDIKDIKNYYYIETIVSHLFESGGGTVGNRGMSHIPAPIRILLCLNQNLMTVGGIFVHVIEI